MRLIPVNEVKPDEVKQQIALREDICAIPLCFEPMHDVHFGSITHNQNPSPRLAWLSQQDLAAMWFVEASLLEALTNKMFALKWAELTDNCETEIQKLYERI